MAHININMHFSGHVKLRHFSFAVLPTHSLCTYLEHDEHSPISAIHCSLQITQNQFSSQNCNYLRLNSSLVLVIFISPVARDGSFECDASTLRLSKAITTLRLLHRPNMFLSSAVFITTEWLLSVTGRIFTPVTSFLIYKIGR